MIAITGANGQLGRLVITSLLEHTSASSIVAVVRNAEAVADFSAKGIEVRVADYDKLETLASAFAGVEKLLLISSNAVGHRVPQHKAVINAAKKAGVKLFAYTSILNAEESPLILAQEHKATEGLIRASGLPSVLLRNGWYTENYTQSLPTVLEFNAVLGCAGEGRFSTAARKDYAEAAATVLTSSEDQAGKVYELAGDQSFSLVEYAAEVSKQSGKEIVFNNMPETDYAKVLVGAGLPESFAAVIANTEAGAANGALEEDNKFLSTLIGRPTTPLAETVAADL